MSKTLYTCICVYFLFVGNNIYASEFNKRTSIVNNTNLISKISTDTIISDSLKFEELKLQLLKLKLFQDSLMKIYQDKLIENSTIQIDSLKNKISEINNALNSSFSKNTEKLDLIKTDINNQIKQLSDSILTISKSVSKIQSNNNENWRLNGVSLGFSYSIHSKFSGVADRLMNDNINNINMTPTFLLSANPDKIFRLELEFGRKKFTYSDKNQIDTKVLHYNIGGAIHFLYQKNNSNFTFGARINYIKYLLENFNQTSNSMELSYIINSYVFTPVFGIEQLLAKHFSIGCETGYSIVTNGKLDIIDYEVKKTPVEFNSSFLQLKLIGRIYF